MLWEQATFLVEVFLSNALWPLFILAFTCPYAEKAAKNTAPGRCRINDAKNSGQSYKPTTVDTAWTDCDMYTKPPYPCGSINAVIFHTSAVKPYGLSGNTGFSFHWINSSICLLFCSVLTYSFIRNGMCIVVSGCLVIVIQLETQHVLNKQKLVRLILFLFFKHAALSPSNCEILTQNDSDAPYHGFWADTMSPIIIALHSRLGSWAICCHYKAFMLTFFSLVVTAVELVVWMFPAIFFPFDIH